MAGEREFAKEFLGSGFKFPVRADRMTGRIQTSDYEEDIREAIHIILMTRKGERVMRPEFGCGIHNYVFSPIDYTSLKLMESEVKEALVMWEPRIIKTEVKIEKDRDDAGRLNIRISYLVRNTNNPYNLVYPYYLNEGIG